MKPEDIHGKKLIAVAGLDIFGKSLISMINKEVADKGVMLIGININEDDFGFFISNLANSKVEVTIFMPEFQKKSAQFFNLDGYLLCAYKDDGRMMFIKSENEEIIDDRKLIELVDLVNRHVSE